ncbi:MAG: hypothetical protein IH590_12850 [Aquamicrobium sp.]|nr:hypothetical protein [Aquamicrobium sp.]
MRMEIAEIAAAARRIRTDAAAIAAAGDQLLVGQAIQIGRLAEWIEEMASIPLGLTPDERRSGAPEIGR